MTALDKEIQNTPYQGLVRVRHLGDGIHQGLWGRAFFGNPIQKVIRSGFQAGTDGKQRIQAGFLSSGFYAGEMVVRDIDAFRQFALAHSQRASSLLNSFSQFLIIDPHDVSFLLLFNIATWSHKTNKAAQNKFCERLSAVHMRQKKFYHTEKSTGGGYIFHRIRQNSPFRDRVLETTTIVVYNRLVTGSRGYLPGKKRRGYRRFFRNLSLTMIRRPYRSALHCFLFFPRDRQSGLEADTGF